MDERTGRVGERVPEPERDIPGSRLDRVLDRVALGAVLTALMGISAVALASCAESDPELPVYWNAPDFALVDQEGDTVRTSDFRGTPWVASFVFTNCTSVCPLITQNMAGLRDSLAAEGVLGEEVRLVSFTVDPARDTPEVLREYAAKFGGSPPRDWAFLTGTPPEVVRGMIQEGFRLTAVVPAEHEHAGSDYQVMHSPRVALVDAEGRVRGVYDTIESDAMQRLSTDLGALLRSATPRRSAGVPSSVEFQG
jgi:protein SCO1/2